MWQVWPKVSTPEVTEEARGLHLNLLKETDAHLLGLGAVLSDSHQQKQWVGSGGGEGGNFGRNLSSLSCILFVK